MQLDVMVALYLAFLLRRTSMTLAANHQRRALLAVIAGGAAVVGIAVLTAGSLASTSRPRTDITPTFGNFTMQFVEPAAFTIVPSPVIETNPPILFWRRRWQRRILRRSAGSLSAVGRSHGDGHFRTCCWRGSSE
jgi:hypothetical protein